MTYTKAFKVLNVFRKSSQSDAKPLTTKHTHFWNSQVQPNMIKSRFRNFKNSTKLFSRKPKQKLPRTWSQVVVDMHNTEPFFDYAQLEGERAPKNAKPNPSVQSPKNPSRSKILNFVNTANSKTRQQMRRFPFSFRRSTNHLTRRDSKIQLQEKLNQLVATKIITPNPDVDGVMEDVDVEAVFERDGSSALSLPFVMYNSAGQMYTKESRALEEAEAAQPLRRRQLRPFGKHPLGIPSLQEVVYNMGGVLNVDHPNNRQ